MSRVVVSLVSILLCVLLVLSLVLFGIFDYKNFDVKNQTLDMGITTLNYSSVNNSYILPFYNDTIQYFMIFNSSMIGETDNHRYYLATYWGFAYNDVAMTSLGWLLNGFNSGVCLIYDITTFCVNNNIPYYDVEEYGRDFAFVSQYQTFYSKVNLNELQIHLGVENFYRGFVLPVFFDFDVMQPNFPLINYIYEYGMLPRLANVHYYPIDFYLSTIDGGVGTQVSYSMPEDGYTMSLDMGVSSYFENVVTVFEYELTHLENIFDITNLNDINSINDVATLLRELILVPVDLLYLGFSILTALTYNLVLI